MTPVIREEKAAALVGLSPRTLQRFRVDGTGPKYVKLGKRVFYTEIDLEKWVEACRRQSTSEAKAA